MSNVAIFCAFVPLKSIPLEIYPVLQQSEQHPVYGMSYQKCWLFEMDQVSEYYGAAEPPWLRNPGNNHLASTFTQPADSIIKTAGRNPMFMSPPIHEYSCAMGSSAIIRYYCYIPCTSTLLQATACHIFHTLYVLSFLICYQFLPQIHYCNHMLQHFQLHLYLFLIPQQNFLRV